MRQLIALGIAASMAFACAAAGPLPAPCEPEEVVVIEYTPARCEATEAGTVCDLLAGEEQRNLDAASCALIALAPDAPAEHEGSVFEGIP